MCVIKINTMLHFKTSINGFVKIASKVFWENFNLNADNYLFKQSKKSILLLNTLIYFEKYEKHCL